MCQCGGSRRRQRTPRAWNGQRPSCAKDEDGILTYHLSELLSRNANAVNRCEEWLIVRRHAVDLDIRSAESVVQGLGDESIATSDDCVDRVASDVAAD